jgi:hypothetical protein
MIPGNRPEDIAEEAFWEQLFDKLTKKGYLQPDIDGLEENEFTKDAITIARELGYVDGSQEARSDEQLAEAAKRDEEFANTRCAKCGEVIGYDYDRAEVVLRNSPLAVQPSFVIHANCYSELEFVIA